MGKRTISNCITDIQTPIDAVIQRNSLELISEASTADWDKCTSDSSVFIVTVSDYDFKTCEENIQYFAIPGHITDVMQAVHERTRLPHDSEYKLTYFCKKGEVKGLWEFLQDAEQRFRKQRVDDKKIK